MSKKMKCYICGEDEKVVNDNVVRRFCWKCVNGKEYTRFKMNEHSIEQQKQLEKYEHAKQSFKQYQKI